MPRRKNSKAPSFSPKKLTQTTLPSLFSSSPIRSTSGPKSPSKSTTKAHRVPFSAERGGSDDDGSSSDVGAIRFEERIAETTDDEQPHLSPMKKRRMRVDSFDGVDSFNIATVQKKTGSDEEDISDVRWKGKGKGKQNVVIDSDGEGKTNERRLVKGVRPPTPDEDSLSDEVDENLILNDRMRSRDGKTIFQRNLEKLKRKKQGKAVSESSRSEDESEGDDSSVVPFEDAKRDCDSNGEVASDGAPPEEDSFFVDDDDAVVPDLPAMFSMNTHQDLGHHFKIICQFFVHLAVKPLKMRRKMMDSIVRDNEYFSLPLQIARRKLSGIRDSLVASSIWRPQFKKLLETYPRLDVAMLDFAVPACDACNLGGRMSTRIGRLNGLPYNRVGFKPLKRNKVTEDEDSDEEKPKMEFHLGRFCAKRTKVFHQFTHWEYHLFEALRREVEELQKSNGRHGFVRVAFSGAAEPPQDLDGADEIMDWLDKRKIIEMEWVKVKDMMESARHLDLAVGKGEQD